jgi:hypothetical protein
MIRSLSGANATRQRRRALRIAWQRTGSGPSASRPSVFCCGLLGALCALALVMPVAGAHGLAAGADTGTIAGVLVDGTRSNAPLTGQQVTLQMTLGAQAQDLTTTTTDAQGRFSFSSLATDAGIVYAVYTRYQGGLYTTAPIRLDANFSQQATLTAYEATANDATLSVSSVMLLVRQPRPANGLIGVGEFVTLHNSGITAFVGTTSATAGAPMGLLRFALPAGATNLTPGVGFVGTQIVQIATGFGATATVPPGDTVFAFAFDMPYDDTQALLSYKAEYATATATVLVPTNMRAGGRDFSAQGSSQAFGTTYQIFQSSQVAQNDVRTLRLTGLLAAGQPSDLEFPALVALAVLLALLAALALGWYLRRGHLSLGVILPTALLGVRPHLLPSTRGRGLDQHTSLLRELLALERDHEAGRLDDDAYRTRADLVRADLRGLMVAEEASVSTSMSLAPIPETAPVRAETMLGGGR